MKRTPLGVVMAACAALGFATGLVFGSLAPALGGLVLLALLAGARPGGAVLAQREIDPGRVGAALRVRLRVTGPPQAVLRVRDGVPVGVRGYGHGHGRGLVDMSYHVVPEAPGRLSWQHVDVDLSDAWGLWEHRVRVACLSTALVTPETDWAAHGRRIGRRHTVLRMAKARRALDPQPEVETVRPAGPYDRLRDIDWARTARLGTLHARQRERAAPRKLIILMEATPSMRVGQGISKSTTAARVALGIGAAARGAGVSSRIIVFTEDHVHQTSDAGIGSQDLLIGLARLPAPRTAALALEDGGARHPTPAERRFLRLVGGRTSPPFDAALALLARDDPAFVVCILDAEVRPRMAEVVVDRLLRRGHQAALIVPGTGAHHVPRAAAHAHRALLQEAMARRGRLAHAMAARGVAVITALPGNIDAVVTEVARRAQ